MPITGCRLGGRVRVAVPIRLRLGRVRVTGTVPILRLRGRVRATDPIRLGRRIRVSPSHWADPPGLRVGVSPRHPSGGKGHCRCAARPRELRRDEGPGTGRPGSRRARGSATRIFSEQSRSRVSATRIVSEQSQRLGWSRSSHGAARRGGGASAFAGGACSPRRA